MKITVIGTGYVGLVTGACLAEMGNHVVCLDVDPRKIEMLNEGGIPIHEPGLEEIVSATAAGRLQFTTDVAAAVAHGTLQFIGVGTPPDEDGSADLQYVLAAATQHRPPHDRLQGHRRQEHRARGHGRQGARRHRRGAGRRGLEMEDFPSSPTPSS
jgi:nucleotide sugar dehydrogenase